MPFKSMSYRDLHRVPSGEKACEARFINACRYANYLWQKGFPARAILALCRACYLDPAALPPQTRQPWHAYVWFLEKDTGNGFIGNPRVSFIHQATRIPASFALKRNRAWALWLLTRVFRPDFPPDPEVSESPPGKEELGAYLDLHGLEDEGTSLLHLLHRG